MQIEIILKLKGLNSFNINFRRSKIIIKSIYIYGRQHVSIIYRSTITVTYIERRVCMYHLLTNVFVGTHIKCIDK